MVLGLLRPSGPFAGVEPGLLPAALPGLRAAAGVSRAIAQRTSRTGRDRGGVPDRHGGVIPVQCRMAGGVAALRSTRQRGEGSSMARGASWSVAAFPARAAVPADGRVDTWHPAAERVVLLCERTTDRAARIRGICAGRVLPVDDSIPVHDRAACPAVSGAQRSATAARIAI